MALDTVQDFLDQARVLLQDIVVPYRYSDEVLVNYLNQATVETARLRPDLVFKAMRAGSFPDYTPGSPTTSIAMDYRYRPAVLFYVAGLAQVADAEDVTDAHAATLVQAFTAKLMTPTA